VRLLLAVVLLPLRQTRAVRMKYPDDYTAREEHLLRLRGLDKFADPLDDDDQDPDIRGWETSE
jgi:hypothetical protein